MLLTLRGTPFLFQGDELGLQDVPIPPDRIVDVDGRDPERAPIPWERPSRAGPGAGFTTGEPWLPITPDAETAAAAVQVDDPGSMLSPPPSAALAATRHARLDGGLLPLARCG